MNSHLQHGHLIYKKLLKRRKIDSLD